MKYVNTFTGALITILSTACLVVACGSDSDSPGTAGSAGAAGSAGGWSGSAGTVPDGGSSTWNPTLPAFAPPEKDVIIGQVVSKAGKPVEGVTVSIPGGKTATTNYDGMYFIADVAASERIVVTFAHPGFVTTTRSATMFDDGRVMANAVLLARGGSVALDSGAATFGHGRVQFASGAVVDDKGNPASSVRVQMTPYDIRGNGVRSAPGDFSATNASNQTVLLETFGMADFKLTDADGNPLKIKDGEKATIEMLLPEDTKLVEGDTVPAWHFDEQTGRWIEQGSGTVAKYSQDPARLAWVADVPHFSSWNCDKEMETTCVAGVVKRCDGTPASGADLMGQGIDYDGASSAYGDAQGSFCLNVRKNSQVRLYAAADYGGNRLVGYTDVTTPDTVSSCPAGPCVQADITLPCTPAESTLDCDDTYFAGCKSCVAGRVVDKNGTPVKAIVKVGTGLTSFSVITDANGSYCAPAGLDSMTTISATGPGNTTGQVTFSATKAGACPSCDQASDLVLDVSSSSTEEYDFSECPAVLGGVTIESLVIDGASPSFATLDKAWISIAPTQQTNDQGQPVWAMYLHLVSAESKNISGQPMIGVSLHLDTPPAGPAVYDVEEQDEGVVFRADAYSTAGGVIGLGTTTYGLGDSGSSTLGKGTVKFDQGFGKTGDSITGRFDLELGPECAPKSSRVILHGTFNTKAGEQLALFPSGVTDPSSPEFKAWYCSLYDLAAMAPLMTTPKGAVQASVDGTPVMVDPDAAFMNTASYSWENDRLSMALYGQTQTLNFTVETPKVGANPITYATFMEEGSDCLYEVSQGTLTLDPFTAPDAVEWLTGAFSFTVTKSQWSSETNCPDHAITGQLGAAVCR